MRALALLLLIACGCAPAHKAEKRDEHPAAAAPTPTPPPSAPACVVKTHAVTAPGRGGVRPDVATVGGAFAVVWEETERHPGVHFEAFDIDANPLGPGVEVADLDRGGAEPKVIAAGAGYVVIWTVEQPDTSIIAVRRVDARGKPVGDVVPAVAMQNARTLAATSVDDAVALAWWTWSAGPQVQNVTWLDGSLQPIGKPIAIARGQLAEPWIDLKAMRGGARATWVEAIDGEDHVFSGELQRGVLSKKLDLGVGDDPTIGNDWVVFTTLADGAVFRAPFGATQRARIAEGQNPLADGNTLCLVAYGSGEASPGDVLRCHRMGPDQLGPERRVLTAPGGVLTLGVAQAADTTGLVYQTQAEGGGMVVNFATVRCATPQ